MARPASTRRKRTRGDTTITVKPGRIPRITDRALVERIIELTEEGMLARPTCHIVGVSEGTLYRWLERGEQEQARVDLGLTDAQRTEQDEPHRHEEEPYREFRERFYRARATMEQEMVGVLRTVAQGGSLIEERTITMRDGSTEDVRKYTAPDAKAAHVYLQHARGGEWARKSELAVSVDGLGGGGSGVAGGPSQIETAQVAERVRANIERARERLAIEAPLGSPENPIEGVIVEEAQPDEH